MMLLSRFRQPKILATTLVLIGLCLCCLYYPFRSISSTPLRINSESGDLVGRIYSPRNTQKSLPVVILGHGMSSSKEMVIPLALELGRNKIASIAFDFGGFGESYSLAKNQKSVASLNKSTVEDSRNILNYIKAHPQQFDQKKIAMVGHSMGGITAIDLGKQEKIIKATVSLGIGGETSINSPSNLLFGIGIYEQLNPPQTLRPLLNSAMGNQKDCDDNLVCGNFVDGSARKLFISPTTDHFTVLYDSMLIKETIDWIQKSWQLQTTVLPPVMPRFIIGILILTVGVIIGLTELFVNNSILIRGRLLLLISILLVVFAQINHSLSFIVSNLIIVTSLLTLMANYAYKYPSQWLSRYKIGSYFLLLLTIAFLIPSICQNLAELINHPANIFYLPLFFFKWLFLFIYNKFATLKTIIFPEYTFQLKINPLLILILAIDSIKLGFVISIIEKLGLFIFRWLNQPFKLGIKNISRRELQILTYLSVILSFVIWQRFNDGLLKESIEYGWAIIRLFLFFIVIPLVVSVFGIRSFNRLNLL